MKKALSILAGITGALFYSQVLVAGAGTGPGSLGSLDGQKNNSVTESTITPDIKGNGQDGPLTLSTSDNLSVTVSLNAGANSSGADWWALVQTPFGVPYYYDLSAGSFMPGSSVTYTGPLFDLGSFPVLNMSGLPQGSYTFTLAVDLTPDGAQTSGSGQWYSDTLVINVGSTTTTPTGTGLTGSWLDDSNGDIFTVSTSTYTLNDGNCTLSGPYNTSGSTITWGASSASGSCGSQQLSLIGTNYTGTYVISGNTLVIDISGYLWSLTRI